MNNRQEELRRILVVDIDGCAFSISKIVNGKLLSPNLVEHALQRSGDSQYYSEFYVCTHRCASSYDHLIENCDYLKRMIAFIDYAKQQSIPEEKIFAEYFDPNIIPHYTEDHKSHFFTHKV